MPSEYTIRPATPDRREDLLDIFGPNGAYSNCWCTWWLLTNRQWEEAGSEGRRELIESMVANGEVPGLLAYSGETVVGWVSVGPRERYARMMSPRSRNFKPIDGRPSWMINCFFMKKDWRGRGVATALLQGAVDYARSRGATLIEGYPKDTSLKKIANAELFVGSLQMFLEAGFTEVSRVGERPLVRLDV